MPPAVRGITFSARRRTCRAARLGMAPGTSHPDERCRPLGRPARHDGVDPVRGPADRAAFPAAWVVGSSRRERVRRCGAGCARGRRAPCARRGTTAAPRVAPARHGRAAIAYALTVGADAATDDAEDVGCADHGGDAGGRSLRRHRGDRDRNPRWSEVRAGKALPVAREGATRRAPTRDGDAVDLDRSLPPSSPLASVTSRRRRPARRQSPTRCAGDAIADTACLSSRRSRPGRRVPFTARPHDCHDRAATPRCGCAVDAAVTVTVAGNITSAGVLAPTDDGDDTPTCSRGACPDRRWSGERSPSSRAACTAAMSQAPAPWGQVGVAGRAVRQRFADHRPRRPVTEGGADDSGTLATGQRDLGGREDTTVTTASVSSAVRGVGGWAGSAKRGDRQRGAGVRGRDRHAARHTAPSAWTLWATMAHRSAATGAGCGPARHRLGRDGHRRVRRPTRHGDVSDRALAGGDRRGRGGAARGRRKRRRGDRGDRSPCADEVGRGSGDLGARAPRPPCDRDPSVGAARHGDG